MKIDCLILGEYQTNCYILRKSETASECLIIDTGLDSSILVDFLKEQKLNPVSVVLTHGHADHIAAIPDLRENFPGIKVHIHKLDAEMLTKPKDNLSLLTGIVIKIEPADCLVEQGDTINTGWTELEVLHTPGHTAGGISLYSRQEGIVFTGDALFADSIGRTDFPGGNFEQLIKSIKEKLFVLADETICYPGHGLETTIGKEKAYNQFLR